MPDIAPHMTMKKRFRGYLPVVVDVETGGLDPKKNALLEIAAVILGMDADGKLMRKETIHAHVQPFEGGRLDEEALKITKIDPYHPFRFALEEKEALEKIFVPVRAALQEHHCQRAVLVGHNAWFDLFFLKAAVSRCKIKKNPFHAFTSFDTATLGALAFGQTVLARAVQASGETFDQNEAHSAIYDAEKTADLFCHIINNFGMKLSGHE